MAAIVRKRGWRDLAIAGGSPSFASPLHVGCPNIGAQDRLFARIQSALDRRWLTNDGPLIQQFEERVAALTGARHCVAVCNATTGLQLCVRALQLAGEVIVPSFTYIGTAQALAWEGVRPVFCDVEPETHNLDPACVARLIGPRTQAILGVHLWGRPCKVNELAALGDRHGLHLLFDAAHAFGCTYGGEPIGRFGDASVFSFHATKVVNSFEGGAVVTDSDDLAVQLRLMRNFGFADFDNVVALGVNAKMHEVSAAMGLSSLELLETFRAINRRNHEAYARGLADAAGIRLCGYDGREESNYHYVIVEVAEQASLSRDGLVDVLQAENVLARRYFSPGCHKALPFRSRQPSKGQVLPVTERLCARLLALPTGTAVDPDAIEKIGRIIALALRHAPDIEECRHLSGSRSRAA